MRPANPSTGCVLRHHREAGEAIILLDVRNTRGIIEQDLDRNRGGIGIHHDS
uniref:Uncharacterized protein n=1 Tax=Candidatus Kentrum sp. LFY TaxID=2126342 RepID=A0A450WZI2_9GAMM|nr:MAG: hypothetical protein BECKLFY1418C_GA0070996_11201 [Candidatus Kentron sp. LFY]